LRRALIDGKPENALDYDAAAQQLVAWNLLEPARQFSEQAVKLAGIDLLADNRCHPVAEHYAALLTRFRQHEVAYERLQQAREDANTLSFLDQAAAMKRDGANVLSEEWRRTTLASRNANAEVGMRGALRTIGSTAAAYYTPEEKLALSTFAENLRMTASSQDRHELWIPFAESAGLADLEVKWRMEYA